MGQLQQYTCSNCNYTAEASTKTEVTMTYVLKPCICNNCKELVMVVAGEFGLTLPIDDEAYLRCPDCGSKDQLNDWQPRKRPCPKCETGKMEPDGMVIMVD